jgi:large subunit ribosomal protein L6
MSRIGKLPIEIPSGVEVNFSNGTLTIKGPKGELKQDVKPLVKIEVADNQIVVVPQAETKEARSFHGLYRSLASNMVEGVTKGFQKRLEINGVGYRAQIQGKKIVLNLGHSHPIEYQVPESINAEIDKEKNNVIVISGINKQEVGQVAAEIRAFRKPEPYKGKGVKYEDEYIRRKAGKAASAA